MALRPLAVLLCGFAVWTLRREHLRGHKVLFGLAAATFVLVGMQLVPLPPSVWRHFPGREIVGEIDRLAELGDVWRPISLVPVETWNALYSLFVPLAVLLLGVQLRRAELWRLLPVIIALGLLSALLGVLQVIGGDGPFYLYRITNEGSAVGLFANRNHAAVFLACLFPMLAVYASANAQTVEQARFRLWVSAISCLFIVPLLLVTGSRGGLLTGLIGLASIPLLFRQPAIATRPKRKVSRFNGAYIMGFLVVAGLGLLTILLARAQAFDRLLAFDQKEEARLLMWGPIANMGHAYFPLGSGFGSFEKVYQLDEPLAQLRSTYVNHAHNDLLEVYLTGGLAAVLLLAVAVAAWAVRTWKLWGGKARADADANYARLASVLLFILGIASVADYPLRVPSLASFAVLAMVWLQSDSNARRGVSKWGGTSDNSVLLRPQNS